MPQPDRLWKLDILSGEPTEDDLQKYWAKCREKLGMVPNVIAAVSANPKKARTFIAMYNELMLGDSGLSKVEREMIAVVVSSANRCYYCLVAHGQAVRHYSGDPQLGEMLVMNYRVAELPPRQRAMLDFERQWWRRAGAKEQAIRDTFGLTPTRYYQALNGVLDLPAAMSYDAALVHRLQRVRAEASRGRRRLD